MLFSSSSMQLGVHSTVLQIATTCTLILWTSLSAESPHWLILRGQMYQAYVTLRRLRKSRILAARDLYRIYLQVGDHDDYNDRNLSRRLLEILTVPSIRRMLLSAAAVMISLDLCGTSMVNKLLRQSLTRIWFGSEIIFKVIIICVSMYATTLIDKWGRRRLLLKAIPRMVLALWFSAFVKILPANTLRRIVEMALQAFFLMYWALGRLVPVVYSSELFPISRRGKIIALLQSILELTANQRNRYMSDCMHLPYEPSDPRVHHSERSQSASSHLFFCVCAPSAHTL